MWLLYSIIAFAACLLIASQLYVSARYFVWYWLVENMPSDIVLALMRQDLIAKYTTLLLAQAVTTIRQRCMTK